MATKEGELSRVGRAEDDTRSPAEIRHDIQRTRADLDATVDALERRMRPRRLLWQARRRVKPELRRAADGVARRAREHRGLLVAGAGAVVALLAARRLLGRRKGGFPEVQRGV